MKFNNLFKSIIILSLSFTGITLSSLSYADFVVIVHPSNNAELTPKQIKRIYLGKMKSYPKGGSVIPLDAAPGTPIRTAFNTDVLLKTEQQITSYWGRLIFTGKGLPPKQLATNDEIKQLVAKNPSTIGYIDESYVDGSIKVIKKF